MDVFLNKKKRKPIALTLCRLICSALRLPPPQTRHLLSFPRRLGLLNDLFLPRANAIADAREKKASIAFTSTSSFFAAAAAAAAASTATSTAASSGSDLTSALFVGAETQPTEPQDNLGRGEGLQASAAQAQAPSSAPSSEKGDADIDVGLVTEAMATIVLQGSNAKGKVKDSSADSNRDSVGGVEGSSSEKEFQHLARAAAREEKETSSSLSSPPEARLGGAAVSCASASTAAVDVAVSLSGRKRGGCLLTPEVWAALDSGTYGEVKSGGPAASSLAEKEAINSSDGSGDGGLVVVGGSGSSHGGCSAVSTSGDGVVSADTNAAAPSSDASGSAPSSSAPILSSSSTSSGNVNDIATVAISNTDATSPGKGPGVFKTGSGRDSSPGEGAGAGTELSPNEDRCRRFELGKDEMTAVGKLSEGDFLRAEVEGLVLRCVNADPNYGSMWFHCRHRPSDTAKCVLWY